MGLDAAFSGSRPVGKVCGTITWRTLGKVKTIQTQISSHRVVAAP